MPPATHPPVGLPLRSAPLRIALIYFVVGTLWIFFSDAAVNLFVTEDHQTRLFQTLKGIFYICATTTLLYILVTRFSRTTLALNADLAASEARFRRLADEVPVALFVVSTGLIEQVNAGAAELFGDGTPGSLVGRPVLALAAPARQAQLEELLSTSASRANLLAASPMTLITRGGDEIEVDLGISATNVGRKSAILLCALDVTERNRLESQLRHAQKQEIVGQMAAGVAHDFNNLITSILGYSKLAARTLPPGHPATAHLAELEAAGEQAASVLRSMLTLARKDPPKRTPIDVTSLVDEAVRLARGMLPANVETRLELPRTLPSVLMGDAVQLKQALLNIASNARDAMPRGGTLSFEITEIKAPVAFPPPKADTPAPPANIRIRIRDTGDGISAENLRHVFEPFFTTKAEGVGTGLGLAITRRIINDHGGVIQVNSIPGEGTTFSIDLPTAQAVCPAVPELVAPVVPADVADEHPTLAGVTGRATGHAAATPHSFNRVLIVEDDPRIRSLLEKWFAQLAWRITVTADAPIFLAEFEADPASFDLLVIDHELPSSTGDAVIRAVRRIRSDAPIIAISGGFAFLAPDVAARDPALRRLAKPFGFEQLTAAAASLRDSAKQTNR